MSRRIMIMAAALAAAILFSALGWWWYQRQRVEAELLAQPVFRVLEEHEPAVYAELLEAYRAARSEGADPAAFANLAHSRISMAATRHLARASQDTVLALVHDMLGIARRLEGRAGDACFRFWFPQVAGPADLASTIDADTRARTLTLLGEVIRSAREQPAPPADVEVAQQRLGEVVNGIYEQFGSDAQMLANAEDPRADRGKVCTITIAVYERILGLEPAQASAVIRVMAGGSDLVDEE